MNNASFWTFPLEGATAQSALHIMFQCPRRTCAGTFLTAFSRFSSPGGGFAWNYERSTPFSPKAFDVAEGIADISPSFLLIANEAKRAEESGLKNICGMGYRKALEFLIKDYCIKLRPTDESEIKQTMLGTCINKFVTSSNVKECAKRATWLGNDETHYERRWEGKDVQDLKTLINLTQLWISGELLTAKLIADMPEKPKS